MLRTACAEAASWPNHVRIAVNVSPIQFRSETLSLKVAAVLSETGLDPRRLELEITEAVLIADDDAALATLNQLRTLGVHIALDDFGTGYSSLQYLQRFPFDKIKIDRSFVKEVTRNSSSASIIRAVVSIAATATWSPRRNASRRCSSARPAESRMHADAGLSVPRRVRRRKSARCWHRQGRRRRRGGAGDPVASALLRSHFGNRLPENPRQQFHRIGFLISSKPRWAPPPARCCSRWSGHRQAG